MTTSSPTPSARWATPRETVERWALVTARDVMKKDVVTIPSTARLSEVEQVLADNRISGAPVIDEAGAIVGIVTLRDLVDRYTEEPEAHPVHRSDAYDATPTDIFDEDLDQVGTEEDEDAAEEDDVEEEEPTAQDIMSAQVFSVPADAGLQAIAALMTLHRVHRVLVLEEGRHVGLISTLEILDALSA